MPGRGVDSVAAVGAGSPRIDLASHSHAGCHPVRSIGQQTFAITASSNANAGRTLQTLSTELPSSVTAYATTRKFTEYYGEVTYADRWAMGAINGQDVFFPSGRGNAQMGNTLTATEPRDAKVAPEGVTWDIQTRKECGAKGTAYMSAWQKTVVSIEQAVDHCIAKDQAAASSWDAGWTYWTGSLEGKEGRGTAGMMTWNLANKRCANFKVCGPDGQSTDADDIAKVNRNLIQLWYDGEKKLAEHLCDQVRNDIIPKIVSQMAVPPIQGALRYANFLDTEKARNAPHSESTLKQRAEGAVFWASVAPLFYACSAEDTQTIYNNMRINADSCDKEVVLSLMQKHYECLGITCADVGGIYGNGEYIWEGCYDAVPPPSPPPSPPAPPPSDDGLSSGQLAGIIVGCVLGGALLTGTLSEHLNPSVCTRADRACSAWSAAPTCGLAHPPQAELC